MRKLFYMGLEPYESRYTYQLRDWNVRVFDKAGIDYTIVEGDQLTNEIKTGSVLDAHGRTHYSLTQHAALVRMMQEGKMSGNDVIFYEDMFTPGIESLGYIFKQIPASDVPRVYVRCLAQTIDPDDFVHRTGMFQWMRKYEEMVDEIVSFTGGAILVASEEMVANLRICGFKSDIYVTGLPFGKEEVQSYVAPTQWQARSNKVCFAARWDDEKQPAFFLAVAHKVFKERPDIEFSILTGNKKLTSNDPFYLNLLEDSLKSGECNVKVYEGLSKGEYYQHLASSKVLFNCALQDWVSNTVSEADALGAMTIYPAYRSFPEVFANNEAHMYVPWSVNAAASMILNVMSLDAPPSSIGKASDYQDGTIQRTLDVFSMSSNYEDYARLYQERTYRRNVMICKYN